VIPSPTKRSFGYAKLSDFEARLPTRPLSYRFDAIYCANGSLAHHENWLARNKHVAYQTFIPAHVPLDVYTFACNADTYLARF